MAVFSHKWVRRDDNVSVPQRVRHGRAMTEADPFIGKILQTRYRVVERVAAGAMGVVYRGERLTLNRIVAIKFLHPAVAQQENLRKRFELEAQAMGRLSHPNCVSVIDFGVQDVPYLVMDFVSGLNLREVISAGGVSPIRALNIGRQLLAALVHAHAHGIIHRDVKPENLILQQSAGLEDHLRVLDFGLAKLMNSDTGLTGGMAVGTPNYMSPEQLQEGVTDARADLYATGIVLFEMLTGAQPFAADSMGEVLRRQLQMPPPRIREIARDVEAHGARRELRDGGGAALELGHHARAHEGLRAREESLAHQRGELRILEARGRPWRGGGGRALRRCRCGVPRRVREHHRDAVATDRGGAAAARRIAQQHVRGYLGDHAIGEATRHHARTVFLERWSLTGRDLTLRALHEPEVGERGDARRLQREEIGPHGRTFSAIQLTSSPGVIAPTCAPTCTSRRARSRS